MPRLRGLFLICATLAGATACATEEPVDLSALAVVDSLYVDSLGAPFTGSVVRYFGDEQSGVEVEASLRDGAFDGELVVYHPNGRVRYMGSFRDGERCGPWTENADSTDTGSVYEDLIREVETLGLYPPCAGEDEG